MADWPLTPVGRGYRIAYVGPVTLKTNFPDGTRSIREKSAVTKRILQGVFIEKETETRDALIMFDMYRETTPLSVKTYDPQSPDPDNDIGLFYFDSGKPSPEYISPVLLRFAVTFREA